MLHNSSHSWCSTHLATSWQQANYSQIGFTSNLTNEAENVFPQPRSCAAKPTQDFFPVPMFHFITSLSFVDAAVCETILKTNNDTQVRNWGLEAVGVGFFKQWSVTAQPCHWLLLSTTLTTVVLMWMMWISWATKVAAFQILPLERSPDLQNQKKPWGDLVHCSLYRKHLCHDWPLQISTGGSFITFLIKAGFLTGFHRSSHLLLVPKSSHSWKYSADEFGLMQHWNSS